MSTIVGNGETASKKKPVKLALAAAMIALAGNWSRMPGMPDGNAPSR
ncbi:MAG: hypothetical protein P8Y53_19080 [Pseudolabrys sp.]